MPTLSLFKILFIGPNHVLLAKLGDYSGKFSTYSLFLCLYIIVFKLDIIYNIMIKEEKDTNCYPLFFLINFSSFLVRVKTTLKKNGLTLIAVQT